MGKLVGVGAVSIVTGSSSADDSSAEKLILENENLRSENEKLTKKTVALVAELKKLKAKSKEA